MRQPDHSNRPLLIAACLSLTSSLAGCAPEDNGSRSNVAIPVGVDTSPTASGPGTAVAPAPTPTTVAPTPVATTSPGPGSATPPVQPPVGTDTPPPPPVPQEMGPAPAGWSTCSICHGTEGQGVANLGPDLWHPTAGYFEWVVRNGRDGNPDLIAAMAAMGPEFISDADLALVFEWLSRAPKATTGEGLYSDYCSNCHGANGGGVAGKDIKLLTDVIATIVRTGAHPGEYDNVAEYMPSWTAEELTDAEVQLITDYVASLGGI